MVSFNNNVTQLLFPYYDMYNTHNYNMSYYDMLYVPECKQLNKVKSHIYEK